jgi:DNA polymerase elongation subunit (family B)
MYRSASYNPFNESIFLRTWTETGDRIETEIPFRPFLYLEKEGASDGLSIFKTDLLKKQFRNSIERRKFVQSTANNRIFYNIPPEQQFLVEMYKEQNNHPDFSKFPLKIFLLDIEVDARGEFPVPEKAAAPINLITVFDTLTKTTHTWGLKERYIPTLENCIYHCCKDEQDLILQFVDFWKSDYCDVASGWNSAGFDFPYLINRFRKLFGEDFIKQLSPVGNVRGRRVFTDMGKEMTIWTIQGISLLDYMDLYKTFSPGERESFSLNYISELELGEGKIAHNAVSLGELAQTDWATFVDYNIQDVHLLVKLEEKLKFLEIARMLSYKGCTNFESALGKVSIVTGAVAIQAAKQGYIIPTFPIQNERESYEGGFVRDPEKGIQKSIVSFDVNSLYPNTIITLNISPETKIGRVVDGDFENLNRLPEDSELTIRLINGNLHKLTSKKFKKFLTQEKLSLSKAGVMYSQKAKGVIPNLIDQIYKERVETKQALTKLKKTKKKDRETVLKLTYFDTLQYTLKILLNSIYGTFANKHSSLMDIDHATSITVTGQNVSKAGGNIIDELVNCKYGIDGSITKYGDTDSLYISIDPILQKLDIPLLNENGEINQEVHDIVSELDECVNEKILQWAREELYSVDPRYVFKREVISDVGVFLQKKRYILHVLDEEGVSVDKFKYTGVELVRSTTPKKVKKFIEDITKKALLSENIKETNEVYRNCYNEFQKLDPNDVAARTSINNLKKYSEGASLYKFKTSTPSHVKGAIAYNLLIKQHKIDDKYEPIETGQKVKKLYCSKNKYGLDAITYISVLPTEFGININWDKMFSKLVTQPIERLYEAIGWNLPEIGKEVQTDLFEMFGM